MGEPSGVEAMLGVVQQVRGDTVRALVEHGAYGERTLCDLPAGFWEEQHPPREGQRFKLLWRAGKETPQIEVLPDEPEEMPAPYAEEAAELLGFQAGDKVLVVLGPNPLPPLELRSQLSGFWLADAGWGEALALTRLPYLLGAVDIRPTDVETIICQAQSGRFDPRLYGDRHVVFLGSVISNVILREHYWSKLGLADQYFFRDDPPSRMQTHGPAEEEQFVLDQHIPLIRGAVLPDYAGISVKDFFLLARVPNPYASSQSERWRCVLSCGIGTIGTGYGIVAVTAAESVLKLLELSGGQDFHMVGEVRMNGFLNPRFDPLWVARFQHRHEEVELARNAISAPAIWDDVVDYTDDMRAEDKRLDAAIMGEGPTP